MLPWTSAPGLIAVDAVLILVAAGLALAVRPWRGVDRRGPPWPWLAGVAALPMLWALDRYAGVALLPPLSGASLLVLMAGWPLAVLGMLPAAGALALAGVTEAGEALHRLAWLGVVPGSVALAVGWALRRWLPRHLFVYILGRGFLGTAAAVLAAGLGAPYAAALPPGATPFAAQLLAAFGEAFLTGMATALLVAFRPEWLATYADRLYLPPAPRR